MKKSKKLLRLKRVSVCGGCKYAQYADFYDMADDNMFCSRHHNSSCCFNDSPCAHYVPFSNVICPRKAPYYWDDDNYIPF